LNKRSEVDWVTRFADDAIEAAQRIHPGKPIVCASGLSPSGPVHLGNLRELMTPHLVAEELRRRGYDCVHLLSWDDYDRFRKVPAGIDPSWAENIGKPLSAVPAPPGSEFPNWAEHFKAPMVSALKAMRIDVSPVSQTENYTSGVYRDQILLAMRERRRIEAILGRYRTKTATPDGSALVEAPGDEDDLTAGLVAEGSGAAFEDDGTSASGYYPYKPYCAHCNKDLTTITAYDDETTELTYVCECGFTETVYLNEFNRGKLVWKVDWPMRWAFEGVSFEPSGVDHSSPGSSVVVGAQIVREVFSSEPPIGPMYAFVGISGMAKMSSSRGAVPTPADALELIEAPLLRWLYARRRPNQSFKIAFDQEIHRIYDEWDALDRRLHDRTATPAEEATYSRSIRTTLGDLALTPRPVPYRTLTSIVDITTGDDAQTLRILRQLEADEAVAPLTDYQPRLACATNWVNTQMSQEQRTRLRERPDWATLDALDDDHRQMIALLVERLNEYWSLPGLTTLVYGVPKIHHGLPLDVKPSAELKAVQRAFFALVYQLLVGRDTGPRLPTLLLAAGPERIQALLAPTVAGTPVRNDMRH
jgi:lysyl-tRNA synthetase, class I